MEPDNPFGMPEHVHEYYKNKEAELRKYAQSPMYMAYEEDGTPVRKYRDDPFPPCGEIHSNKAKGVCNLNYHDEFANYHVEKYLKVFEEDWFKDKEDVTHEFMQYMNGLFNGIGANNIKSNTLIEKIKNRFEGESLTFFFDASKMKRASTFDEDFEYFTIWDTDFDKRTFYPYFENGISLDDLLSDWEMISKRATDRFYLEGSILGKINLYYFRVYKNKISGYNKVSKEKRETTMGTNGSIPRNDSFGDKAMRNGKDVLDMNKNAVKLAAKLKAGSTANQVGLEMIRKALPNKRVVKATKHPVAEVLLANVVAMAIKQASVGNHKAEIVSDAMVTAAMVDLVNTIDLKAILDKIVESVDVSGITDIFDEKEDK